MASKSAGSVAVSAETSPKKAGTKKPAVTGAKRVSSGGGAAKNGAPSAGAAGRERMEKAKKLKEAQELERKKKLEERKLKEQQKKDAAAERRKELEEKKAASATGGGPKKIVTKKTTTVTKTTSKTTTATKTVRPSSGTAGSKQSGAGTTKTTAAAAKPSGVSRPGTTTKTQGATTAGRTTTTGSPRTTAAGKVAATRTTGAAKPVKKPVTAKAAPASPKTGATKLTPSKTTSSPATGTRATPRSGAKPTTPKSGSKTGAASSPRTPSRPRPTTTTTTTTTLGTPPRRITATKLTTGSPLTKKKAEDSPRAKRPKTKATPDKTKKTKPVKDVTSDTGPTSDEPVARKPATEEERAALEKTVDILIGKETPVVPEDGTPVDRPPAELGVLEDEFSSAWKEEQDLLLKKEGEERAERRKRVQEILQKTKGPSKEPDERDESEGLEPTQVQEPVVIETGEEPAEHQVPLEDRTFDQPPAEPEVPTDVPSEDLLTGQVEEPPAEPEAVPSDGLTTLVDIQAAPTEDRTVQIEDISPEPVDLLSDEQTTPIQLVPLQDPFQVPVPSEEPSYADDVQPIPSDNQASQPEAPSEEPVERYEEQPAPFEDHTSQFEDRLQEVVPSEEPADVEEAQPIPSEELGDTDTVKPDPFEDLTVPHFQGAVPSEEPSYADDVEPTPSDDQAYEPEVPSEELYEEQLAPFEDQTSQLDRLQEVVPSKEPTEASEELEDTDRVKPVPFEDLTVPSGEETAPLEEQEKEVEEPGIAESPADEEWAMIESTTPGGDSRPREETPPEDQQLDDERLVEDVVDEGVVGDEGDVGDEGEEGVVGDAEVIRDEGEGDEGDEGVVGDEGVEGEESDERTPTPEYQPQSADIDEERVPVEPPPTLGSGEDPNSPLSPYYERPVPSEKPAAPIEDHFAPFEDQAAPIDDGSAPFGDEGDENDLRDSEQGVEDEGERIQSPLGSSFPPISIQDIDGSESGSTAVATTPPLSMVVERGSEPSLPSQEDEQEEPEVRDRDVWEVTEDTEPFQSEEMVDDVQEMPSQEELGEGVARVVEGGEDDGPLEDGEEDQDEGEGEGEERGEGDGERDEEEEEPASDLPDDDGSLPTPIQLQPEPLAQGVVDDLLNFGPSEPSTAPPQPDPFGMDPLEMVTTPSHKEQSEIFGQDPFGASPAPPPDTGYNPFAPAGGSVDPFSLGGSGFGAGGGDVPLMQPQVGEPFGQPEAGEGHEGGGDEGDDLRDSGVQSPDILQPEAEGGDSSQGPEFDQGVVEGAEDGYGFDSNTDPPTVSGFDQEPFGREDHGFGFDSSTDPPTTTSEPAFLDSPVD